MAINIRYKKELEKLLEIKNDYSKKEIITHINVAPNWITRNIDELISMGFNLKKQSRSETRLKDISENLSDIKKSRFFLLKHYINLLYVDYGLIAPFSLEGLEKQNTDKISDYIDLINSEIIKQKFDYNSLLLSLLENTEDTIPVNILVFLRNILNSIPILQHVNVSEELEHIINNTFNDMFDFLPTEEQLQVVAKALKYASDVSSEHKMVSIQSDAGSSKSTCALVIQAILRPDLNPLIVAKTNKAISGIKNARTIARFLYETVNISVTQDTWEERRLKAAQNEDVIDFLIIDESSQVGELDRLILSTICKKILYLGDRNQCFSKGTLISMYDGSVKKIEDIKIGDYILDPYSNKKRVLSLCSGLDQLFTVQQSNGISYTVNKEHILCLKETNTDRYIEISVEQYLLKGIEFKTRFCGFNSYNNKRSKITIFPLYPDCYYGIGVEGSLLVLSDGTVTHNCKPIHDKQAIDVVYLHSLKKQYRFLNSEMEIEEDCFQTVFSSLYKQKRHKKLQDLFETSIIGSFNTLGYYEREGNKYVLKNDYYFSFNNYLELLKSYTDDNKIILAYSQNTVDVINNILNEGNLFKINSKVSLKINDYNNNQFNGFQYRILEVRENNTFLCKSIDSDDTYIFSGSWLILSYALTTMSAQGSQWDHVLGIDKTCISSELWTDRYVMVTRASKSVYFLTSDGIEKDTYVFNPTSSPKEIVNKYKENAKEGNRNNTLYSCIQELNKIKANTNYYKELRKLAITSELPIQEIDNTFERHYFNNIFLDNLPINTELRTIQYYTPVFKNGKTLIGKERVLSLDEVTIKYPNAVYIAEELKNSNRIVIDCDSKETVLLFSHLLDKTESYISEERDSAHLVFITNKIISTKHKTKIDLLGNEKFSLRNIKKNKVPNNLKPIELTQEVLDIFNEL